MTRYRRAETVDATAVDGEIFLIEPNGTEIFYLDEISSGIWRLLDDPQGIEDLEAVFCAAFPDIERERIRADVTALLQNLVARGLVTEVA